MSSFSESALRAACGKRVWDRAEELLEWPALSALSACGEGGSLELFGQCHGSESQHYSVRVRVQDGELAESSCSCLFDGRGPCKHRVALVLTLARKPDKFRVFPSLVEMIGDCSLEILSDLVAAMVRRSPDLLPLLAASRGGPEEPLRETLSRALSGHSAADGAPVLERVWNEASQLEARGDWFAAGELWSAAVEELAQAAAGFEQLYEHEMESSEGYHDEEGWDFGGEWARQAVEGLGRALETETLAPEAQRAWARALWTAERAAGACEYFVLPDRARDLLSRFAPDDLWADIEATIRAELKAAPRQRNLHAHALSGGAFEVFEILAGDDWKRGRDVEFLLGRLRSRGRIEDADVLVAELGTTKQQFELLVRRGNFAQAQKLAKGFYSASPHRLLQCATQLEDAGASELAFQLVMEARESGVTDNEWLPSHFDSTWGAWLCDFHLRHKDGPQARSEAVRLFAQSPDPAQFERLQRAVELSGEWNNQRQAVEREVRAHAGKNRLGASREGEVALSLALNEKDAPRVLALFEKLSKAERPRFLEAVADAIEGELPAQALPLWRELATWTIDHRDTNAARRSYASAAKSLLRARALHQRGDSMGEWRDYLQTLREVYKPLRALHDELKKAGL